MADTSRTTLWIFGIYSGDKYKTGKLHKTSFVIGFLFAYCLIAAMFVKMLQETANFEVFFEIVHILITQLSCVVKTYYFYRCLPEFNTLEERLKSQIFNLHTSEQNRFVRRATDDFKFATLMFQGLAWVAALAYSICPVLDGIILAIPIWSPFGDIPKIYLQIFESACFFWLASVDPAIDLLSVAMMGTTVAQLDILNDNLRFATDRNAEEDYELQERKIQDRLRKCVEHHLAIKSFSSETQAIFSLGVFLQIFASILSICMTGLQFLRIPVKSASFVSIIIYFITMLVQIGTVCFYGEEIITKSQEVREACYMSEWYSCSTSTKKMLFVIMEVSKREIVFRAGNFFDMSLATFVMIMRNAYSYFAVLVKVLK